MRAPTRSTTATGERHARPPTDHSLTACFRRRMIPHIIGWFPYTATWVVYFSSFIKSLEDIRQENEALYDRIPDFVIPAVGATFLWFTLFTVPQWRYQYVSGPLSPSNACIANAYATLHRSPRTTIGRQSCGTAFCRWGASSRWVRCSTPTCSGTRRSPRRSTTRQRIARFWTTCSHRRLRHTLNTSCFEATVQLVDQNVDGPPPGACLHGPRVPR